MSAHRKHKHRGPKHFSLTDASEADSSSSRDRDNHRNRHDRDHDRSGDRKRVTALIVKVDENSFIDPYISFDIGLGGKGAIEVSEDGSAFTFRKSGMYQLNFSGTIELGTANDGQFIFEQSPTQPTQQPFTVENISSGRVNVSTILSFRRGHRLRLTVTRLIGGVSQRIGLTEFPVVGAGSKFEIVRVSDI